METKEKKLSELIDKELLLEAKKEKSNTLLNAMFIGVLIGIVLYSIMKDSLGFFTIIPLYFAYKLLTKPKKNSELEQILKERNLK